MHEGFNDVKLYFTGSALAGVYGESRRTRVTVQSILRKRLDAMLSDPSPRFHKHTGSNPERAYKFSVNPHEYAKSVRFTRAMGLPAEALGMLLSLYVEKEQ